MKLNKHIEILREISGNDFKSKNILLASELAYNMSVQTDYTKAIDLTQQKIVFDENRNPELLLGGLLSFGYALLRDRAIETGKRSMGANGVLSIEIPVR